MRCSKCGYLSFDSLDTCKKCGRNLGDLAEKLQGTSAEYETPFFLGPTLGIAEEETDHAPEEEGVPGEEMDSTTEIFSEPEGISGEVAVEETDEEEIDFDALMEELPSADSEDEDEAADIDMGEDEFAREDVTGSVAEEEVEIDFDTEESSGDTISLEPETEEETEGNDISIEDEVEIDFDLDDSPAAEIGSEMAAGEEDSVADENSAEDIEELDLGMADFDLGDEETSDNEKAQEDLPPLDFEDIDLSDLTAPHDHGQQEDKTKTADSFDDLSSLSLESDTEVFSDIDFLDDDEGEVNLTAEENASGLTLEKDE